MSKKNKTPFYWWLILGGLFLLMLKANKVLPDPPGIDLAANIAVPAGVIGIFAYQVSKITDFQGRISALESRVAHLELDMTEVKASLQYVRDTVNQIVGRLDALKQA